MRIPLLVRGRGTHASSADRLFRFRKVLKSAQRSLSHRHSLRFAGLDTPASLQTFQSVEEVLPRIPLSHHFERSRLHRTRCHPRTVLVNPLPGKCQIADYSFPGDSPKEILAGTFQTLIALAGRLTVERALIVITGVEEGVLSPRDRDALWSGFGVPAFEQFLGLDGQLIAHECEAHDGLHIMANNSVWEEQPHGVLLLTSLTDLDHPTIRLNTGLSGAIRSEECACGRTEPRVTNLRPSVPMR